MDDILLADSNRDILEQMFHEEERKRKEKNDHWGLQIASEKTQRGAPVFLPRI